MLIINSNKKENELFPPKLILLVVVLLLVLNIFLVPIYYMRPISSILPFCIFFILMFGILTFCGVAIGYEQYIKESE